MKQYNIKTITCHNVYNHGASLQEYALLKYLSSLGHNVETINYKPKYLSGHFNLLAVSNPKYAKNIFLKYSYLLAKLPTRLIDLKRKKVFDKFSKKYISEGIIYKTNDELKRNIPNADIFICGSDQIWNTFFPNGKDPAFYLDFVPKDKKKISYAASFAIDKIETSLKKTLKKQIENIDVVSVRELSGLKILEDLDIKNATQVLDPVFLLNKNYWEKEFVSKIDENYILIYDFDTNKHIKNIALELSKKHNLKIFALNKNINYANKNFWLKGPDTFLSLIANAKIVLTNSFHAVAFSLIFNKQLMVFNRNEAINTRMRDLLILIESPNLLFNENKNNKDVSITPIDNYNTINKNISNVIEKSKQFLKQAIQ